MYLNLFFYPLIQTTVVDTFMRQSNNSLRNYISRGFQNIPACYIKLTWLLLDSQSDGGAQVLGNFEKTSFQCDGDYSQQFP